MSDKEQPEQSRDGLPDEMRRAAFAGGWNAAMGAGTGLTFEQKQRDWLRNNDLNMPALTPEQLSPLSDGVVERTPSGETWNGIKVRGYLSERPTGLPLPSSQHFDVVDFHWSTGPKDAIRLVALDDVIASLQHGEHSTTAIQGEEVSGADRALAASAVEPVSRLDPTGFDHGESKCDATCLNCAGSGQVAVMTGTHRDLIAYYNPCPNGPAPDVADAAWGLIDAVEGGDSIPRACGILRWALVAESNIGVLDALRSISSQLGAGLADNVTDPMKLVARIQWGVDHIQSVEAERAADLIGELSEKPQTTWGQVRTAVLKRGEA